MRHIGRRRNIGFRLAAMGLLLAILVIGLDTLLRPAVTAVAVSRAEQTAGTAVAEAMEQLQQTQPQLFTGLAAVQSDPQGVRSVSVDAAGANRLKSAAALAVMERFRSPEGVGFALPLGTLSGIQLLSGTGPEIPLTVQLNGAAACDFRSEFRAAGINQVLHRLLLDIRVEVTALLPLRTVHTVCQTQYLVCETVLLGEVPLAYLPT